MATRVGLTKIWMTQFDWLTPKTPSSVQKSGTYLYRKLSYGKFCVKISKFCYHGNRGCLTQILLTQLNRLTPKTAYLVQESSLYLIYKLGDSRFFFWNLTIIVAMPTRVCLTKIVMTLFDWTPQKPPVRCKNLGPILNASWVVVNFVWKFEILVSMATGVGLTQISFTQLIRQTPITRHLVQ